LPPLRARRSDIPALAERFLAQYGAARGHRAPTFTDTALHALLLHDYPGNVRELENIVQRAVTLARGPVITLDELPPTLGGASVDADEPRIQDLLTMPLEQAMREFERLVMTRALVRAGGNKAEAARLLDIRRQYLYARLKDLDIEA
jgi:DNA-binding NtrC family response regulator